MDVYLVSEFGAKPVPIEDLPVLLLDPTALVWVDIPRCDASAALTLAEPSGSTTSPSGTA